MPSTVRQKKLVKGRPISILLVDDHAMVRDTLGTWLATNPDMTVVGSASNADDAVTIVLTLKPDIVLMDIDMPGLLCFDAARTIRSRSSETRIIFLSAFFNDHYISEALRAQASGYLTKAESPDRVATAIRAAASGRAYFSPEVESRIVIDSAGPRLAQEMPEETDQLTPREVEVLRYLARGMSKKDIGSTMRVSVKTVDNHSTSLMQKLDLHDRVELARFAIRSGLAEP